MPSVRHKRFVWATCIYSIILSVITLGPPTWGPTSYMAASFDKHSLLRKIPGQRVILVGGSNVAMGVNSPRIEREVHVPVINMALAASFGLRYELEEIKTFLHKGDLILLMPEFEYFAVSKPEQTDVRLNGCANLLELAQTNPETFKWALASYTGDFERLSGLVRDVKNLFFKKIAFLKGACEKVPSAKSPAELLSLFELKETFLKRSNFNESGDFIGHLSQPSTNFSMIDCDIIYFPYQYNLDAHKCLVRAAENATEKGAQILILPPSVPSAVEERKRKIFGDIYSNLRTIKSIHVLAEPGQYALPRSVFFDCNYHLDTSGREMRTSKLIKDLLAYMKSND